MTATASAQVKTRIEQLIENALKIDYRNKPVETKLGTVTVIDFTANSVQCEFSKLSLANVDGFYSGAVTLVKEQDKWQLATGLSDRPISVVNEGGTPLQLADQTSCENLIAALIEEISGWHGNEPIKVLVRELQVVIEQKQNAKNLAIAVIQATQKIVDNQSVELKVVQGGIKACEANSKRIDLIQEKTDRENHLRSDLFVLIENTLKAG